MLTVRIEGFDELQKKLDGEFLLQPEVEPALDTVAKRWEREGKGLGEQRNELSVTASPLIRELRTTLNPPRTTGAARRDLNVRRYLPPVIRNALKKAAKGIAARFGS